MGDASRLRLKRPIQELFNDGEDHRGGQFSGRLIKTTRFTGIEIKSRISGARSKEIGEIIFDKRRFYSVKPMG
jgi:hypothetical protein